MKSTVKKLSDIIRIAAVILVPSQNGMFLGMNCELNNHLVQYSFLNKTQILHDRSSDWTDCVISNKKLPDSMKRTNIKHKEH